MKAHATACAIRAHLRARRSRGQALVEFAAFFVFIMILVAGVVDVGGLLDDHVSIEYATRQGARTAAVLGTQSSADCAIIGAIGAAVANMPNMAVSQIIIYKAGSDGLPLGTSSETIYPGNTTCTVSGATYTLSQAPSINNYPPASRTDIAYTEDTVGIELDYTYTFQLPILGAGTFSAADRTAMPVSPITVPTPA
jgi:Flp pilus assembly protein TadG